MLPEMVSTGANPFVLLRTQSTATVFYNNVRGEMLPGSERGSELLLWPASEQEVLLGA